MDAIEVAQAAGDRINPARVRITHEDRVLDTTTVFTVTVTPQDQDGLGFPTVEIEESPPVRCYLYDWLQYVNFKLQCEFGNVITGKEQQKIVLDSFDVYPRRQASYCLIQDATWVPEYTDLPAQTVELYELLDELLKLPCPEFEDETPVLVTATRVLPNGDRRVLPNGDVRIGELYG